MKKLFHLLLVTGVMLSIAGCDSSNSDSDSTAAVPTPKADTPMQAFENFRAALLSGDTAAAADCFVLAGQQRDAFEAVVEFSNAVEGFDSELTRVFGEDAAAQFGLQSPLSEVADINAADCSFTEAGDTAVCTSPDGTTHDMVKADGVWKFTADDMPLDDPDFLKELEGMKAFTAIIKEMTGEVGKEGMTMEQLQATFVERMMAMTPADTSTDLPTELPTELPTDLPVDGLDPSDLMPRD